MRARSPECMLQWTFGIRHMYFSRNEDDQCYDLCADAFERVSETEERIRSGGFHVRGLTKEVSAIQGERGIRGDVS
jgi:hypothetical protein